MVAWAVALALGAHVLYGYAPFPVVDDFAYAPLAEAWADPTLYPHDDQLHGFADHAWAYTAVYLLAKATVGVASGFWIAVVILTVAAVLALHAIMVRFGVAGAGLPLALAVGVMLVLPGVGRGTYGGFVSIFFHHQFVSLVLVMWAFAATLARRPAVAGVLLGLAAYAQPMSAFHGAIAVAAACLLAGPGGLRALAATAATAIVVALPAEYMAAEAVTSGAGAPIPSEQVITDAYLFRMPHHYTLAAWPVLLGWGYLALGLISAGLLRRRHPETARMALGLLAGLGIFYVVTTIFYCVIETHFLPILQLDASRSSPLLFALAGTLFATALEERTQDGRGSLGEGPIAGLAAVTVIGSGLVVANATPSGWFMALAGLLALSAPRRAVLKAALGAVLGGLFLYAAPTRLTQEAPPSKFATMFDWARSSTAPDALFVVPPGMQDFRLYAERSIYADFKLFSVAQPAQAWLTEQRLEQIAKPDAATRAELGWAGIRFWDRSYSRHAGCIAMLSLMEQAHADYFVRPDEVDPSANRADCGGTPAIAYSDGRVTVFARRRASGATSQ